MIDRRRGDRLPLLLPRFQRYPTLWWQLSPTGASQHPLGRQVERRSRSSSSSSI
jgi:hypothetical protein